MNIGTNARANMVVIRQAQNDDAQELSRLISESNKDVAVMFGLNADNCPKHPSFCHADWVVADMSRGETYFLLACADESIACVGYEEAGGGVVYLNRLSVLPAYRKRGFGEQLVRYVIDRAHSRAMRSVSIGVIGEHSALQCWYGKLGFVGGETRRFEHLPFSVRYMAFTLSNVDEHSDGAM